MYESLTLHTVLYAGAESFIHLQVAALGTRWGPEEASTPHMFGERVTESPWYLWILVDTAVGLANPSDIYFPYFGCFLKMPVILRSLPSFRGTLAARARTAGSAGERMSPTQTSI